MSSRTLSPAASSSALPYASVVGHATRSSEHTGVCGVRRASRAFCSSCLARVIAAGSSKTTTTCAPAWMALLSCPASTPTYASNVSTEEGVCITSTLPSTTTSVSERRTPTASRASWSESKSRNALANLCLKVAFAPFGPPPSPMFCAARTLSPTGSDVRELPAA